MPKTIEGIPESIPRAAVVDLLAACGVTASRITGFEMTPNAVVITRIARDSEDRMIVNQQGDGPQIDTIAVEILDEDDPA